MRGRAGLLSRAQPTSHDALAAALDDYAGFAEARTLAERLRNQSACMAQEPPSEQQRALELRNRLVTMLYDRMQRVRSVRPCLTITGAPWWVPTSLVPRDARVAAGFSLATDLAALRRLAIGRWPLGLLNPLSVFGFRRLGGRNRATERHHDQNY